MNCQCKWLSALPTAQEAFVNSFPSTEKLFLHETYLFSLCALLSQQSHLFLIDEVDGYYKVFFHAPYFGVRRSAGRSILQCSLYISATSTPRRKALQRSSSSLSVSSWFPKKLTWLQVTSLVLHGGTAVKTTSVLLTKQLWTVSCPRHRGPHHCGELDPFRTLGPTSVDFSNHLALSDPGKWTSTAPFPFLAKPLVYVPPIKAAITKRGCTWILLIGATHVPGKIRTSHALH